MCSPLSLLICCLFFSLFPSVYLCIFTSCILPVVFHFEPSAIIKVLSLIPGLQIFQPWVDSLGWLPTLSNQSIDLRLNTHLCYTIDLGRNYRGMGVGSPSLEKKEICPLQYPYHLKQIVLSIIICIRKPSYASQSTDHHSPKHISTVCATVSLTLANLP